MSQLILNSLIYPIECGQNRFQSCAVIPRLPYGITILASDILYNWYKWGEQGEYGTEYYLELLV